MSHTARAGHDLHERAGRRTLLIDGETRFRQVFSEHYESILRYCLRRLPVGDANDAAADVFVVAWRRFDELPAGEAARPWLYGVARNVVRNVQRSSRRRDRLKAKMQHLAVATGPSAEAVIVRNEDDRLLIDALGKLSAGDQEILRLRTYEQLSSVQIAAVIGCSATAARKRLSRAVGRLRKAARTVLPDIETASGALGEGGEA